MTSIEEWLANLENYTIFPKTTEIIDLDCDRCHGIAYSWLNEVSPTLTHLIGMVALHEKCCEGMK